MKVSSKHTSYGHYPEASCKVKNLKEHARKTKFLEKLIVKCRTDAEQKDHHLVKKIAAGRAKKVKHHPSFAYLDNRIARLNASRVTLDKDIDFILAGSPRSKKKEIRDHLYHTFITSDCTLWFTLNECHDRPRFWSSRSLKEITFPDNWKITNVKEEVVAKRGPSGKRHNPKLIRSTLLATNGKATKTITHYHYDNWPDHRPAPSEKLLLKCAKIAIEHLRKTNSPVGINCKAGVGRTGILANLIYGMQYIRKNLEAGKKLKKISINPAELNYDLRRQRKGMVSHPAQFVQVYKALATFAKKVA